MCCKPQGVPQCLEDLQEEQIGASNYGVVVGGSRVGET